MSWACASPLSVHFGSARPMIIVKMVLLMGNHGECLCSPPCGRRWNSVLKRTVILTTDSRGAEWRQRRSEVCVDMWPLFLPSQTLHNGRRRPSRLWNVFLLQSMNEEWVSNTLLSQQFNLMSQQWKHLWCFHGQILTWKNSRILCGKFYSDVIQSVKDTVIECVPSRYLCFKMHFISISFERY